MCGRFAPTLRLVAAMAGAVLLATCRGGGGEVGGAGTSTADASIAWSANVGCTASLYGVAVAPDGAIYVAGYQRPDSPPPGYASADNFWQVTLSELDASGGVVRRLGGTVSSGRPEVWVAVAPWGAGYAVDALGGVYGLLPAGVSHFTEAGIQAAGPLTVGSHGELFVGGAGGVFSLELQAVENPATLLFSTGGSHASAPAVGADGSFFFSTTSGGRLLAVSPGGELLWQRRVSGARPALGAEGHLYLSVQSELQALAANGEPLWDFTADAPLSRAPVPAPDGSVYCITQSGLLYSVDRGQKRWSFALERPVGPGLAVDAAGTVYAVDRQGKLYAIGADGLRRFTLKLPPGGTPVPGPDGTVYVPDLNGTLHAVTPPLGGG